MHSFRTISCLETFVENYIFAVGFRSEQKLARK